MAEESPTPQIRDESAAYEVTKYTRGENPRSLANLKPWTSETVPQGNRRSGPMVTPALRRLSELPRTEVEALLESGKLNSAEEVAARLIIAVLDGSDRGSKARDQLINRLDGEPEKSSPAVAVQVNLQFGDGQEA